ncbi:hypothetical protein FGSG_11682 [Fusarium graminearum PH-1]|uniref:Chromosome 1, complete genome n=1 Tax=Gibberella zeae (strain ATCC MYA-4620 / CBS 123657 / FGSC 9075 / NRRL 31084 / PH-1) TaxID=229533 RepID=I1S4B5_GIBZE|nr:hypothetical protein FGSG_11682 [Fusarium graminearum PH-1]ESU05259.1 hypothetical protein FGSG_11682 [Fusarium graminearum PH-1]CEF71991.1 unnamed protein product [Fusarium graminearum]|eukprot:XP_011315744.1 hypothetical protein FGSG_11682 [Fusarium graminearum PH-1]
MVSVREIMHFRAEMLSIQGIVLPFRAVIVLIEDTFLPVRAAIDPFRVASVPREVGAEGFDSARAVDHGLGQEIWAWILRYKYRKTDGVKVLYWTLRLEFEALVDQGH